MSFARDAKMQILETKIENDCCMLAFLSGLLRVSGEWDVQNKTISIVTDINELYDFCNNIITKLYGNKVELSFEYDFKINKTKYYRISFPKENTAQILTDLGIMTNGHFDFDEIDKNIIASDCCKKNFIKGVFIGSATSGIRLSEVETEKTSTGYGIEFICHSKVFLENFFNLLTDFNILPRIVKRKKHYVLYIKESNQICDILAIVEAFDSVLKLQDELSLRELRNKVNRQTNCLSANINKTVDASFKQVEAINKISESIGLESLPLDLQEVALVRLANPEESLSDLLPLLNTPQSKSSLNYRFNKILKIADKLEIK